MMGIKFIIIVLVVTFAGCAGSPARIGMMSSEELREINSLNLCNAYAFNGSEPAKIELQRRNVVTDEEWALIEKKQLRVGMSQLGLICSWGKPGTYGSINKTVTQYGESIQWVYRSCEACKTTYVYTDKGKVTTWQQ